MCFPLVEQRQRLIAAVDDVRKLPANLPRLDAEGGRERANDAQASRIVSRRRSMR
jgi:hypothetical protein